ncbi:MAG: thioredoxin family protein [Deltaproteobacteria bacterium]|nr:thioredoxin family protein [Deltaproteobacteria bacterium]
MRFSKLFTSTIFTLALLIQLNAPSAFAAPKQAKIGESAPEFTLTDNNGKQHRLSDYKGKYVILEWFNKDCPFVKKHYESGNMQKLQKEAADKGAVWFTITSSAEGKQGYMTNEIATKVLADSNAQPTAWLADPTGEVGKAYDARTTPHMYVINPEGKLVYAGAIDDKATTDEDDIAEATNYVSSALSESMAGQEVSTASTQAYGCSIKYAG